MCLSDTYEHPNRPAHEYSYRSADRSTDVDPNEHADKYLDSNTKQYGDDVPDWYSDPDRNERGDRHANQHT